MIRFELLEPHDLAEACSLLSQYEERAKMLAGGQSLLPLLKKRKVYTRFLINIKGLLDLEYISNDKKITRIGTLVTNRAIELSDVVRERHPMLAEVERTVGDVQTRNWGTLVGNLCAASPTSDLAPALIALKAIVKARSVRGERRIPLGEFFSGYLKTILDPDEIVTEIEVPELPVNSGAAYHKERVRMTDSPIASAAAAITLDENFDSITSARIVLQAVGPVPLRAKEAEERITGEKFQDNVLDEVANIAATGARPISDAYGSMEYKREMVKVATRVVITKAVAQAKSEATKKGLSK
jgi:carbon-monoxide dehydrogenase medium subunit